MALRMRTRMRAQARKTYVRAVNIAVESMMVPRKSVQRHKALSAMLHRSDYPANFLLNRQRVSSTTGLLRFSDLVNASANSS